MSAKVSQNTHKQQMAYLVSQYPAISHTFILREIRILRSKNFAIRVASVNHPDRPVQMLTQEEKQEWQHTYYVKAHGLKGAFLAHAWTLLCHPLSYFKGLLFTFSLAKWDLKKWLYGLLYFVEAVMIGHWMKSEKQTHLHVHFATPASTVGLIATHMFSFGFSMTVHGPDEFYDTPGYYLSEKIQAAQFVCCIGLFARSQLMKLSNPSCWYKFEVTPLGVDPDHFAPMPFHHAEDCLEILCVGRLVPAKGQMILLDACRQLKDAGCAFHLSIVGDGPDRVALENYVKQHQLSDLVSFEGAVNQERILAYYEKAHVFALASFAEGIPVVLMEAMSMQIPCVTTHITGIPELIQHGIDGLLVPPSDSLALSEMLQQLHKNPKQRQDIGRNARLRIIDRYHIGKNVDRLAMVFNRHLEQGM